MGLQRLGDSDMNRLLDEMESWSSGQLLEQRAAAVALCEPRLLVEPGNVRRVLDILDRITAGLAGIPNRHSEEFRVLFQGMSYCWSVAVAALPDEGKRLIEKWAGSSDPDIRRIMKENLKKNRLAKMDADWVKRTLDRLTGGSCR